jgi:hypothetical protein
MWLFTLGSFCKITEVEQKQNLATFIHGSSYVLILTKMRWAIISWATLSQADLVTLS